MSLIKFDNYPGVYDEDELIMYKVAEITSQLDLCLRTLDHTKQNTRRTITGIFKSLEETINPLLTNEWDIVPLKKSKLYKESK